MAKSLIITEKPSVAQEFARILGVSGRNDGYIENDKYVITWCVGHLVEMVYPEEYDEKYKRWRLEDLPFLPEEYKYNVIPNVSKQYDTVHRMLFREDIETVYWAGDAGKEGQTIEENIRNFGGVRDGMEELRVWIDSQTEEEIQRGIREAKPMSAYENLGKSGIMRTIEDYAMGINFSRVMSVKYGGLLNNAAGTRSYTAIAVGRVMTCVLGMVVIREREIRNFKETPFYRVVGNFTDAHVQGEWKAVEGSGYFASPLLYKENGFREKKDALALIDRVQGHSAIVESMEKNISRMAVRIRRLMNQVVHDREQKQKNDGKNIQDAHEAIRPSDVTRVPAEIKESLTRDQFRLYQLIWKRFVASRMQPAKYETTSVKIGADDYRFTVSASKIIFEGFRLAYVESDEEKQSGNVMVNSIDKDSELTKESFDYKQHFTQPPAHYTEASLVKTLEELGIGRPSTYAPTISTIITRRYVAKENKNLYMTELGEVVNNIMKQSFASIVDVNFTAYMEGLLDMIAEGKVEWKSVISNFYPDLKEAVEKAEKELETVKIEDEVTDVVCEECGRNMVIKYGPHGKFLACPGFPECRNTKPYLEKIGVACPKCGKDIVLRKTKKGRRYYGCEDNPECDFMSWQKPSEEKCPKCGSYMVEKGNKLVCGNEQCGFVKNKEKDEK